MLRDDKFICWAFAGIMLGVCCRYLGSMLDHVGPTLCPSWLKVATSGKCSAAHCDKSRWKCLRRFRQVWFLYEFLRFYKFVEMTCIDPGVQHRRTSIAHFWLHTMDLYRRELQCQQAGPFPNRKGISKTSLDIWTGESHGQTYVPLKSLKYLR